MHLRINNKIMVYLSWLKVWENWDKSIEKNNYDEFLNSQNFRDSIEETLKNDDIFNQSIILDSFKKVFDKIPLNKQEFNIIKRIMDDDFFLKNMSLSILNEDWFKLFNQYQKEIYWSSVLPYRINFEEFILDEYYKVVVLKNFIKIFFKEIYLDNIKQILEDSKNKVWEILKTIGLKDIELIYSWEYYKIVKEYTNNNYPEYLLFDVENNKFIKNINIDKNLYDDDILLKLENWDIAININVWNFNNYIFSLNTKNKLTPYFSNISDLQKVDWQTIIWISTTNDLWVKSPYSLEQQKFVDKEKYIENEKVWNAILTFEEVYTLLEWVSELKKENPDDWAEESIMSSFWIKQEDLEKKLEGYSKNNFL